ncbi:thioredoxin domain-containing protein [Sphingomonas baiyangensis]|nr:thioredoxin domain-containing protein [Sphingomonas baiyangensis]
MRVILALAPIALLAACGGDAGNSSAPAEPVAGATPPAGQQWTEVVSETPEGGFRMGNPDAPIKLVEYGSRGCPACAAFARDGYEPLTQMVSSGKVSFEFRDFLLGSGADIAAAALGRCGGPGPFFPIMEQMYANQPQFFERLQAMTPEVQAQMQNMSPAEQVTAVAEQGGYLEFVQQRGIPEAQARACLADTATIERLVKATQDATEVTGTPSFFINGDKIDAVSWEQVQAALRQRGA